MKPKATLLIVISLLLLPSLCQASKKREIIIGFGGGYSLGLDGSLHKHVFDEMYHDPFELQEYKLLYFTEQAEMKHRFNFNIQYFFSRRFGLQLEFDQQKASYFSHLQWYGSLYPDGIPDPQDPANDAYTVINHIEEPYRKEWSVSSLTLSIMSPIWMFENGRTCAYVSAGAGFHLLSGDKELVLNRFRLGPKKMNYAFKASGGFKHQLSPKLGLNFRIFMESIVRYTEKGHSLFYGPDQFDLDWYLSEGKIGRVMGAIVRSYAYGGIDFSLEFKL